MQRETKKENTYISSIKSLVNKKVRVGFNDKDVVGILVGANFNPLNVVLKVDNGEKIMIIKGPSYVQEL